MIKIVITLSILDNTNLTVKALNKDKKTKDNISSFILSVSKWLWQKNIYLDYRVTNRGGKGIIGIINSPRNEILLFFSC